MIGRPEYTLSLPPPCPTNRDHLRFRKQVCVRGLVSVQFHWIARRRVSMENTTAL